MALDQVITEFDKALRAVFAPAHSRRPLPGGDKPEAELSEAERRHVAGLMRIDHCGEICAQALYQGQAIASPTVALKKSLAAAADEETEHLAWTAGRLAELGSRKSLLNPLWYMGSLTIGVLAGKAGDAFNLGFLAETERQVERHLQGHLAVLPAQDQRSRAILEQMKEDEIGHSRMAESLGAAELPGAVKLAMKVTSRLMTKLTYYV